jgi:hypothetical protein
MTKGEPLFTTAAVDIESISPSSAISMLVQTFQFLATASDSLLELRTSQKLTSRFLLDTKLQSNGGQHYLSSTHKELLLGWEAITSVLMDTGLPFDTNHLTIVLHFQSFCFLGKLDLVKKLLGPDLEENVHGKRRFLSDFILPLYSAMTGGKRAVLSWLLEQGADVYIKYPNTNIP